MMTTCEVEKRLITHRVRQMGLPVTISLQEKGYIYEYLSILQI